RAELGGPAPSPLERLLVERVVMTWLQTAYHDALAAQSAGAAEARLRLIHQQQSNSERRHLAAVKQLALVRKLLKPTPSTLQLLRYPVDEGSGAPGTRHTRRGPVAAGVGAAQG